MLVAPPPPIPITRPDFTVRAFTIGIAGAAESGKSMLLLALCRLLRDSYSLAVAANDHSVQAGKDFLLRHKALAADRIAAIEAARSSDPFPDGPVGRNLDALESLMEQFRPELLFVEGGAADDFIHDVADFTIFVMDACAGEHPARWSSAVEEADLLVINKTRIGPAFDPAFDVTVAQVAQVRSDAPIVFAQVRHGLGVVEIARHFLGRWRQAATV
jgi:urease accessory protein